MKIYRNSGSNMVKITIFFIAFIILISFLAVISDIVKLMIISALLAYVLDPLASFLESRGMSRTSATSAIFLFIFAIACISSVVFLPVLYEEIKALQVGFNSEKAGLMVSDFENFLVNNLAFLGVKDLNLLSRIQGAMARVGSWIFDHFLDAASVITGMVLIPFIVFFLMKDGRRFKQAFVSIMPNRYFEFTLYLFYKLNIQIGNYLRGQLLDAIIVGIFSIVAFTLIRLIDDILVQPIVVAKSVHMHPLIVLLAVLIGGKLFGILGMLLSVPVVGFLKVVVHESIINYRRYRAA